MVVCYFLFFFWVWGKRVMTMKFDNAIFCEPPDFLIAGLIIQFYLFDIIHNFLTEHLP